MVKMLHLMPGDKQQCTFCTPPSFCLLSHVFVVLILAWYFFRNIISTSFPLYLNPCIKAKLQLHYIFDSPLFPLLQYISDDKATNGLTCFLISSRRWIYFNPYFSRLKKKKNVPTIYRGKNLNKFHHPRYDGFINIQSWYHHASQIQVIYMYVFTLYLSDICLAAHPAYFILSDLAFCVWPLAEARLLDDWK